MRRLSDDETRMLAHQAEPDLALLALELLARIAEQPDVFPVRRPLLERLEAER